MNKQELIEKYEKIINDNSIELYGCYNMVDKLLMQKIYKFVLDDLKQLDEPQKVTVPQFVADYIDFKKTYDFHVYGAMRVIEDHYDKRVQEWFYEGNIETFARAWLDGYTVEEKKRYIVKMKGIAERYYYLNYSFLSEGWFFDDEHNNSNMRAYHTRKELEDAGFGEVFNSPLFEVEEMKG